MKLSLNVLEGRDLPSGTSWSDLQWTDNLNVQPPDPPAVSPNEDMNLPSWSDLSANVGQLLQGVPQGAFSAASKSALDDALAATTAATQQWAASALPPPSAPEPAPQFDPSASGSSSGSTWTRYLSGNASYRYKVYGDHGTSAFSFDVSTRAELDRPGDPTGQGSDQPTERVTVTYSAWVRIDGQYVYNMSNVTQTYSGAANLAGGGSMFHALASGASQSSSHLDAAWAHVSPREWTSLHRRDTREFQFSSTGGDYVAPTWFSTVFSYNYSFWDWAETRTHPNPSETEETHRLDFGGNYYTDVSASDQQGGLPTTFSVWGRPSNWGQGQSGAAFFDRVYDSGSFSGDVTSQDLIGVDGTTPQSYVSNFSLDGADGHRRSVNRRMQIGSRMGPNNTAYGDDNITLVRNYEQTGSYDQKYNANLSYSGGKAEGPLTTSSGRTRHRRLHQHLLPRHGGARAPLPGRGVQVQAVRRSADSH